MHILTPDIYFPHPDTTHESGILAIGGDLSTDRLRLAYQCGTFPWFNSEDPIIWWHPNPRFVIIPSSIKVSKSIRSTFNKNKYTVTFDLAFEEVVRNCKTVKRKGDQGTWITEDIIESYVHLHKEGIGHSVEVWEDNALVGGLYGISLGKMFFGESMFSKASNSSKVALITLAKVMEKLNYWLIDCQIPNPHLKKMGGEDISRNQFMDFIRKNIFEPTKEGSWTNIVEGIPISEIITW